MKRIGKICAFVIVMMLVTIMAAPAVPAPPGQGGTPPGQGGTPPGQGGSPPGIQQNSGWTIEGDNLFTTYLDCNVGIGTTSPSGKLEVVGNIVVSGTVDGIDIDVEFGNLTNVTTGLQDAIDAEEAARIAADNTLQANINAETTARIAADNTLQADINNLAAIDALDYDSLADLEGAVANGFNIATISGNVGIGIISPTQKLSVAGNIQTSGSFIAGLTTYGNGSIGLSSGIELNIDSGTLFINSTTDRVGIGTISPSKELHVAGDVLVDSDLEVSGDVEIAGELDPKGGIVSSDTIIIESLNQKIKLIAGNSIITIDPSGGITIESKDDISINSEGILGLHGKTVSISSDLGMEIETGTYLEIDTYTYMDIDTGTDMNFKAADDIKITSLKKMEIDAGTNMDIDAGLILDIKGSTQLKMRSSGITDIRGSRINLNPQFGGRPAARQNDMVMGFCPPFGGPLMGGNILMGSNTVFIG